MRAIGIVREIPGEAQRGETRASASAGAKAVVTAAAIYRARRMRNELFGRDAQKIFGEPSWDILLDLFIETSAGRSVSVTSSCIAADAPSSTGQRHIRRMEKRGLVVRTPDPHDARRTWLRLTPRGHLLTRGYLDNVRAILSEGAHNEPVGKGTGEEKPAI